MPFRPALSHRTKCLPVLREANDLSATRYPDPCAPRPGVPSVPHSQSAASSAGASLFFFAPFPNYNFVRATIPRAAESWRCSTGQNPVSPFAQSRYPAVCYRKSERRRANKNRNRRRTGECEINRHTRREMNPVSCGKRMVIPKINGHFFMHLRRRIFGENSKLLLCDFSLLPSPSSPSRPPSPALAKPSPTTGIPIFQSPNASQTSSPV